MRILKYGNINDMPKGWRTEEWHYKAYHMWYQMWIRVSTHPSYKDSRICDDYIYLSKYINDIPKLDNFDLFKENPKGWSIDKDIKIPGNKEYKFEALSLVTRSDNCKDRNNRCGNPFTTNNKCVRENSGLARRKPVRGINKKDGSILEFESINETRNSGFDPTGVCHCLRGKIKSHRGYYWEYI